MPGLLLAAFAAAPVAAETRRYEIDPVHTRVWFEADHLGFSRALGTFASPRGVLWFDADDPTASRVEVEIDLTTLDLGDADWNARIARKDFLSTAEHPVARFRSTRVEADESGGLRVHGELALRGVVQDVVLDARLNRAARHPLTLRSTLGFSASASLSRRAFGMRAWKNMVGDAVQVRVELEAKRSRGGTRGEDGPGTRAEPADHAAKGKLEGETEP